MSDRSVEELIRHLEQHVTIRCGQNWSIQYMEGLGDLLVEALSFLGMPTTGLKIEKGDRRTMTLNAPERAGREGDSQQLPVINDSPDVQSAVITDIKQRRELGIRRYGTALQPHNGRNALLDAYEEAIDLAMYLKQRLIEENA